MRAAVGCFRNEGTLLPTFDDRMSGTEIIDPDSELVRRAQAGDYAAFEELVGRHERHIYALALRIVGKVHDAEEVVQQTFLSVIEHLKEFRADAKFSTWLVRIATNHALLLLRKRSRRNEQPLGADYSHSEDDDDGPLPHPQFIAAWRETPDQLASRRETQQALQEALAELGEKHRVVFVLRDVEGLSTAETAEVLGISEANVKVRLLRARLMLRERLTHLFGDESKRVEPHAHDDL